MMSPLSRISFFCHILRRCVCYVLVKHTMTLTFVPTILFKDGKSVSINLFNRTFVYGHLFASFTDFFFSTWKLFSSRINMFLNMTENC